MLKNCDVALSWIPLTFLIDGVHIWHNGYLWRVEDNEGFGVWYDYGVKNQGQQQLKPDLRLVHNANSSYVFDGGCSYLAQWLPMVCRWQQMFRITRMALES